MAPRRFVVGGGGTLLLYAAVFGLQPILLISSYRLLELTAWTRRFHRIPPDLPDPWAGLFAKLGEPAVTTAIYAALVIGLFVLYAISYRAVREGAGSLRSILGFFVLFAAVLAPAFPIFSNDVFAYIAHGELVDTKQVSPYEIRMEDHRDLAVTRWAPRMRLGSVYGPLALRVFQWLHVTGAGPVANLMIFKTFAIVALLGSLLLVYRTMIDLGRDAREAKAALLLFAWNPLVLLDGVLNCHVDVLILFLFALGSFLVVRRRTVVGLAVISATAAVKITFLFLVPALLAWAWRSAATEGGSGSAAGARRLLQAAALGAAANLVWFLPDWVGGGPLTALSELRGYAGQSLTFALRQGLKGLGLRGDELPTISAAVFAAVLVYRSWALRDLRKFLVRVSRDVMLALLFFFAVIHPWYALAMFPSVTVAGVRRHVAALVLLSGCFLLISYGLRMALASPTTWTNLANFFFGVLPAGCVFLFGVGWIPARWRRPFEPTGSSGAGTEPTPDRRTRP